jgi:hypothetical protein
MNKHQKHYQIRIGASGLYQSLLYRLALKPVRLTENNIWIHPPLKKQKQLLENMPYDEVKTRLDDAVTYLTNTMPIMSEEKRLFAEAQLSRLVELQNKSRILWEIKHAYEI